MLISILFFTIHFSGDHVFNKTNSLKLFLLTFSVTALFIYQQYISAQKIKFNDKILFLMISPIISTFPGLIISNGNYNYALPYELASQVICVMWGYLIFTQFTLSKTDNQIRMFIWCLIPIIIYVCIIALLEKNGFNPLIRYLINPFESGWLNSSDIYSGPIDRVKSTFGNINYFASFLIQLIPIMLFFFIIYIKDNNLNNKIALTKLILILSALLLMLISLQSTGTRAAIAALIVSLAFFFVLYFLSIKRLPSRYTFIGLFILTIAIFFSEQHLIDRFSHLFQYNAWLSRIIPWEAAWNSVLQAPFFGYGTGASYQLFFEFVDVDSRILTSEHSYNHVHFEYLEILQEGGIFGLLVYFLMWGFIFVCGLKLVFQKTLSLDIRILSIALLSGLLAYQLHGLFSVAPRMIASRMVAYTLIGILLSLGYKYLNFEFLFLIKKTKYTVGVIIISLLTIWLWLTPYLHSQYEYASALASPDRDTKISKLSMDTTDIYTLNEATSIAIKQHDGELLQEIIKNLELVFPNYRKAGFYKAYAEYLSGDLDQALNLAINSQKRDRYLLETNILLMKLSFELNDKALFRQQFSLALTLYSCKNRLFQCDNKEIRHNFSPKVLLGKMGASFQVLDKKSKLSVFIDLDFFNQLKSAYSNSIQRNTVGIQTKAIVSILGKAQYFKPRPLNSSVTVTSQTIQKLTKYLRIKRDVSKLKMTFNARYLASVADKGITSVADQAHEYNKLKNINNNRITQMNQRLKSYEADLNKMIRLSDFLKKRELLIDLANWLALSTKGHNI